MVVGESVSKKSNMKTKRLRQNVFLFFFLLFPMLQFVVFYIGVNFNSFILAFQKIENGVYVFNGFNTFGDVLKDIFVTGELTKAIKNSAIQFIFSLLIIPINIMTAYGIFKKIPFSGFFKIMLFMPNMISSLVFVACATYLIRDGFQIIFNNPDLRLLNTLEDSSFYTVLVFGLWMQFASGLVIYLGAMGSISQEVMEYGKIENLSTIKELWYVVIPLIFPTITTYLVVSFAGFFSNYGFFHSFFGGTASTGNTPYDTLGYVFFVKILGDKVQASDYSYAAAGGLLFTAIVAPITLFTKSLLEKYGPSEE